MSNTPPVRPIPVRRPLPPGPTPQGSLPSEPVGATVNRLPPGHAAVKVHHKIKPRVVPAVEYTAVTYEADVTILATGQVGQIKVRFRDAQGNALPDGAVQPSKGIDRNKARTLLNSTGSMTALAGESLSDHIARALLPYVSYVYGIEGE